MLNDSVKDLRVVIISTGSEVGIVLEAAKQLQSEGINVSLPTSCTNLRANMQTRVVSMPCCELFDEQSEGYRTSVLPDVLTFSVVRASAWRSS